MRCMLLYFPIFMKKYLLQFVNKPIDEATGKQITQVIMKKLKLIKFAAGMLLVGDLHVKQVAVSLETIGKYG